MSRTDFDDNCPDCRPAILDLATGRPLPEWHADMQTALAIWSEASLEEKRAFHAVTCNNSVDREDMYTAARYIDRVQAALTKA